MLYFERYSYLLNFCQGDAFLAILKGLISKTISASGLTKMVGPPVPLNVSLSLLPLRFNFVAPSLLTSRQKAHQTVNRESSLLRVNMLSFVIVCQNLFYIKKDS